MSLARFCMDVSRCALCLCVVGVVAAPLPALALDPESVESSSDEPQALITAEFPGTLWQFYSGRKDAVLTETWKLGKDSESMQPILICRGEPHGYLRTRKAYRNFDLSLEWRYPSDPNGNSGILLFTAGADRIWPSSLQIQLHQPEAGNTFPIGGAKTNNELRPKVQLAKPVNQWNHCRIRCRNGTALISINGQLLGTVTGCQPAEGAIGLQSEGSEIHFRNIQVQEASNASTDELSLGTTATKQK